MSPPRRSPARSSISTVRCSTRPPCCRPAPSSTSTAICATRCAVPFDIPVLYQDEDIVVADKPHFLATMPRGRHVAQTALVRLRRQLDLDELSPAHRLDRLTAGVLLFTTRREVRGAYQTLFARGAVHKTYLARAAVDPNVVLPRVVCSRIIKRRSNFQAVEEAGEPNAETLVELCVVRWSVPADTADRAHPPASCAHGLAGPADLRRPAVSQRHRRSRRRLLHAIAVAGATHGIRRSAKRNSPPIRQFATAGASALAALSAAKHECAALVREGDGRDSGRRLRGCHALNDSPESAPGSLSSGSRHRWSEYLPDCQV